jgi:thioredoxin reductase
MGVNFPTAAIRSLAKELASVVSPKGTGPEDEDPQASKRRNRNALKLLSSKLGDPCSLEFKSWFVKHCQNLKYLKAVLKTLDKEGLLAPLLADLVNFKLHDPSEDRRVRLTNEVGNFTRYFNLPTFDRNPDLRGKIKNLIGGTPILIIGAGPAGIMQAEALIGLGVPSENIKLIDEKGKLGGIWKNPFAREGSINSPSVLQYNDIELGAAPRPGQHVLDFLGEIREEARTKFNEEPPEIIKGKVQSIKSDSENPGGYLVSTQNQTYKAPIVINAMGLGPPKDLNSAAYMSTNTAQSIIRSQRILDEEGLEKLKGKTVVFIGLGNSTAEMIKQFTDFNKQQDTYADRIRFKVLIHKSQEEIENPNANQPERHLSRDPFTKMAFNIVGVFNLKKQKEKHIQRDPEKRPSDEALYKSVVKGLRERSLADYIKDIIKVEELEDDYPKREDYFKRKLEIAERLNLNFNFVNPHQIVRYITKGPEKLFRSPANGNLVSYQGDLGEYYRLYYNDIKHNIISDVAHWDLIKGEDGKKAIRVYRYPNDSIPKMKDIEYDQIYGLTGYKHKAETFERMSISQDKNRYPKLDSDGEVINEDNEVSPGYFLIGAASVNSERRNNITMPGIMNQIYSSSFGAVLRAIEYQLKDSRV